MHRLTLRGSVFFVLLCLCACSRGGSYYPLDERLTWDYAVTVHQDRGEGAKPLQSRGEAAITNLPRRVVNGVETTPRMYSVGSQHSFLFTTEDESGVHVVAKQLPENEEPVAERSDVLRYPASPGTGWEDTGTTHFLAESVTVPGRTTIASDGETVSVPGGRFRNCKRLVFTGATEARIPRQFGSVKVEVETEYWLAPSVGMVKMIHKERTDQPTLRGGDVTLELRAFKKI